MSDAFERIAAIVDAARPISAPEISRAQKGVDAGPAAARSAEKKPARPKRARADRLSPIGSESPPGASQALPHALSADPADNAPPPPDAAVPPPAAPGGNVVAFRASSQSGGSAAENPGPDGQNGGERAESPADGGHPPPPDDFGADDLDRRLAFYPLTDLGNAERFRERNRGRLMWCPALGWLWWNGKCWSRDGADERVKAAEHATVRAIQQEAKAVRGTNADELLGTKKILGVDQEWHLSDGIAAWGRTSEQANHLSPIAKHAASYLAVAPDALDADPYKFNVANGTLVIRRHAAAGRQPGGAPADDSGDVIAFRPHDPADLITKCSRVVYDPVATSPVFDNFLAYVQPKEEDRRFLLAWQGLSLTGDVTDQKLCVFWGKGKNGKSTFIDICAYAAGDYSETVPIETFLAEGRGRNAGQATPDLAILPGVRHLRTSEPDKGAKLAEALIKLATGGEPILARHLNRDYFKFYPQFKLTISGNYRPQIAGSDEGIWRRVQLVPWSVTVPKDEIDPDLGAKLRAEASGVLNRLLDGLRDWLEHGLVQPESVSEATAAYRRDSDPLGRFIETCIATAPGQRVQSSVMHELFCAWAKANGTREWSNKGMSDALKERGFQIKQSNVMWWLDVKLTRGMNDFVDHEGKPLRFDDGGAGTATEATGPPDDDVIPF